MATLKRGHPVRIKSGKHAGKVGRVHKDMGTVHTVHVMLLTGGMSYQPASNVAPAPPPEAPPAAASDMAPGQPIQVKTGKHAGEVGSVHADMGQQHLLHIMMPDTGLTYQPMNNLGILDPNNMYAPGGSTALAHQWTPEAWEAAIDIIVNAAT